MRNTLFLLIALASFIPRLMAQPEVSLSEPFEMPGPAYSKVLQLTNGYTHFYHIDKTGINITVYDEKHQQVVKKVFESDQLDIKRFLIIDICAIYEINNEAVVFISHIDGKTPKLMRLRIKAETAEIIEYKNIFSIEEYGAADYATLAAGYGQESRFELEKDQFSGSYAVACLHYLSKDSKKRIRLLHFSADHNLKSDVFFGNPGNFKYMEYITMTVNEDRIIAAAYGYNTRASGGKDSRLILGRLKSGESEISSELLDYTDDYKQTTGIMSYNPGNKKIQLLTSTFLSTDDKYFSAKTRRTDVFLVLMSYIDPETLTVTNKKEITYKAVKKYISDNAMPVKAFGGMPQNMIINDDYTTTIFAEQLSERQFNRNKYVYYRTDLETIGILELDTKGDEISGKAILKNQQATFQAHQFDHRMHSKGFGEPAYMYISMDNTPFMSYGYLQGPKGRYILYNDEPENINKSINGQPDEMKKEEKTTLAYVDLFTEKRGYVFGKPEKNQGMFVNIWSSSFQKSNNTFAAMVMQRVGRKVEYRIVWLTAN